MKTSIRFTIAAVLLYATAASQGVFGGEPAYWKWAPTPPMGWNSYDTYGSSVREAEFLANAEYMQANLFRHGWQYVVVDYRWYDATAANHNTNGIGGPVTLDAFSRVVPAPNRFPSAAEGKGFKPLADKVHGMGLKFGIHVMRGIPRQAVAANAPIEGSTYKAGDVANPHDTCNWCKDMFGLDSRKPGAQDYYDSVFRLYASWGVDFVKVDDLSRPYHKDEIDLIRSAIDKCGRPIVFSTSPGETPVGEAAHVATHANMWRMADDAWDKWGDLYHLFDLAAKWQDAGGPGHWPDADMIPLGHIAVRSVGHDRKSGYTKDEQVTLMTLLSLIPSPLMLGMNLPDNDEWTNSLINNDEVIAINQDPLGKPAKRISQKEGGQVWVRDLKDGSRAVGLVNRGNTEAIITLDWSAAGLSGKQSARDLWQHKDLGSFENQLVLSVPKHGAVFLQLREQAH
jgi:hypothetical protein